MSAELLRRAAEKMRENAEAADPANPRPWEAMDTIDGDTIVDTGGASLGGCPDCGVRAGFDRAEAVHIASWHPNIARGFALLLEKVADNGEVRGDWDEWEVGRLAVMAARTYLGEAS